MKIERMTKGSWGKIRAFFDVRTEEGLVVKGFKLVEGSNGPFVGMPSQKDNSGNYNDTVYAEQPIREELTKLAIESYGGDFVQAGPAAEPPPFSEDDIPF